MTEKEWLACEDPRVMLSFLRSKASKRRTGLLFAAACCRRVWQHMSRPESRAAVETAELFADGRAGKEDRIRAWKAAMRAVDSLDVGDRIRWRAAAAGAALSLFNPFDGVDVILYYVPDVAGAVASRAAGLDPQEAWYTNHPTSNNASFAEAAALAGLMRDVLGPLLFRGIEARPAWASWNDCAVPKLAQAAYDERTLPDGHLDPGRLAILADALEEAGCSVPDILDHLRGQGPHVRGCWVVDLLTGRQ